MDYEDIKDEEENEDEEEKEESSESSENANAGNNTQAPVNTPAPTNNQPIDTAIKAGQEAQQPTAPSQQPATPAPTSTLPENSPYRNGGQSSDSTSNNQPDVYTNFASEWAKAKTDDDKNALLTKYGVDKLQANDPEAVKYANAIKAAQASASAPAPTTPGTQALTSSYYNSINIDPNKTYGQVNSGRGYVYSYDAKQLQNDINRAIFDYNKKIANGTIEGKTAADYIKPLKVDGMYGSKTKDAISKLQQAGYNVTNFPASVGGDSNSGNSGASQSGSSTSSDNSTAPNRPMTGNSMSAALADAAKARAEEEAKQKAINDTLNGNNNLPEDAPPMQISNASKQTTNLGDALSAITLGRGAQAPEELNGNPVVHAPSGQSGDGAYWNSRMDGAHNVEPLVDIDDLTAAYNQNRALSGQSERFDDRYYREQNQGGNDMSANATWDRWYQEDLNSGLTPDEVIERARAEGSYEGNEYARYIEGLQMMEKYGIGTSSDSSAEAPQSSMLGTGSSPGSFAGVNVRQQPEPAEPAPYTDPNAGVPMSQAGSMSQALASVNQQPEPVTDATNGRYDWRYANEQGNYDMSPDAAFSRWYQQDSQNGLSVDQMIEAARAEGSYEGRQYANWLMSNGSNLQAETSPQEYMAELEQLQNNRGLGGRPARIELPTTEPERQSMTGNSMSAALENRQPDRMMPRGYATPANESLAGNSYSAALESSITPPDTNIFRQDLEEPQGEMASDDVQSSGTTSPEEQDMLAAYEAAMQSAGRARDIFQGLPTEAEQIQQAREQWDQNMRTALENQFNNPYMQQFRTDFEQLKQQFPNYSDTALMDMVLVGEEMRNGQSSYYKWLANSL